MGAPMFGPSFHHIDRWRTRAPLVPLAPTINLIARAAHPANTSVPSRSLIINRRLTSLTSFADPKVTMSGE